MKRKDFFKSLLALPFIAPLLSKASNSKPKLFVWTEEAVQAGAYITRCKSYIENNIGFGVSITCQIGYLVNCSSNNKYTLNSIADGWVFDSKGRPMTKLEIVEHLNYYGYRPTTPEELLKMITYCQKTL